MQFTDDQITYLLHTFAIWQLSTIGAKFEWPYSNFNTNNEIADIVIVNGYHWSPISPIGGTAVSKHSLFTLYEFRGWYPIDTLCTYHYDSARIAVSHYKKTVPLYDVMKWTAFNMACRGVVLGFDTYDAYVKAGMISNDVVHKTVSPFYRKLRVVPLPTVLYNFGTGFWKLTRGKEGFVVTNHRFENLTPDQWSRTQTDIVLVKGCATAILRNYTHESSQKRLTRQIFARMIWMIYPSLARMWAHRSLLPCGAEQMAIARMCKIDAKENKHPLIPREKAHMPPCMQSLAHSAINAHRVEMAKVICTVAAKWNVPKSLLAQEIYDVMMEQKREDRIRSFNGALSSYGPMSDIFPCDKRRTCPYSDMSPPNTTVCLSSRKHPFEMREFSTLTPSRIWMYSVLSSDIDKRPLDA